MTGTYFKRPKGLTIVSIIASIAAAVIFAGCRSSKQAMTGDEGFFVPVKSVNQAPADRSARAADQPSKNEFNQVADSLIVRQKEQERRLGALNGQLQLLESARKGGNVDSVKTSSPKPVQQEEVSKPGTVSASFEGALRSFAAGQYKAAAQAFNGLLQPGIPKDLEDQYRYYLGMSYLNLRQFDSASASLKAITGRKGSRLRAEAFFGLGQTYKLLGAGKQARSMFEAVLKESPKTEVKTAAEEELRKLGPKK